MPYQNKLKDYECKKKWAKNHKDKVRESNLRYVLHNKDKVKESNLRYVLHNKDKVRESKRKYNNNHRNKIKIWEKDNIEKVRQLKREWDYRNKEKKKAYILSQRIPKKTKCEFCGDSYKLQKHHPDYSQPFYVITLCDKCHKDFHTNVRRLKNGI
jgi:hypothetical protein